MEIHMKLIGICIVDSLLFMEEKLCGDFLLPISLFLGCKVSVQTLQSCEGRACCDLSYRDCKVYQWIVKPQTTVKLNEMFLPGRMSFIFDMIPDSGSWNYHINGVKHNTNLTCGIKLGSMVTLITSARLVG
ncbi:uncharacterized protein LOC113286156 [Papaver somniferum]|uniref:uncharacterized protein LOC113286156 n=1 Tax=Papaver somniferum TaxID=3469 RepID=UPI000E701610|nr:uncharacterized protein LOC113286156 [Papaver somniferum]XP_026390637.1 uncharacterized protein LOC113286156 [Papaver somniferum]XP_026390638.1 uncharacterized protein LOC113286156 [Papaver somniferum]